MWITKKLSRLPSARLGEGEVAEGGRAVLSEREYRAPESVFPYGLVSVFAPGQRAVMAEGKCIGVRALPPEDLAAGEVRLYSAGGAEILLKNTGEVVINGQVFPAKEDANGA